MYWKIANIRSPKIDKAFEALTTYSDEHRKHLILAVAQVRKIHKTHKKQQADFVFTSKVLASYQDTKEPKCACLSDELLLIICNVVLEFSEEPQNKTISNGKLGDRAIARMYDLSKSTLAHVRASAKTKYRRPVALGGQSRKQGKTGHQR